MNVVRHRRTRRVLLVAWHLLLWTGRAGRASVSEDTSVLFVSRPRSRGRAPRFSPVVALAVVALMSVGATMAAWSDFVLIGDNRVGAGTLVIHGDEHLELWLPDRGTTDQTTLGVTNAGSTAADLSLVLERVGATGTLCDGYVAADHGGDLRLLLDGVDMGDLCALLDAPMVIGSSAPGATVDVAVVATLASDALLRWSGRTGTFPLEVRGAQPGGGFSDFARGALTVRIGDYAPDIALHESCSGELGDYRAAYELRSGRTNLDLDAQGVAGPAYVLALNGNHDIVGTPQDDCIVVGNGTLTVHAREGDDTIVSAHPNGKAEGGGRAQQLAGEDGDDTIIARRGNVGIDGGGGTDACEAPSTSNVTIERCEHVHALTAESGPVPLHEVEPLTLEPAGAGPSTEPTDEVAGSETVPSDAPSGEDGGTENGPDPGPTSNESPTTEGPLPNEGSPSSGETATDPATTE